MRLIRERERGAESDKLESGSPSRPPRRGGGELGAL